MIAFNVQCKTNVANLDWEYIKMRNSIARQGKAKYQEMFDKIRGLLPNSPTIFIFQNQ